MKKAAALFGHFRIAVVGNSIEVQNLDHDSTRPPRFAKVETEPKWLCNGKGECIGRNPNYKPTGGN